MDPPPPPGGLNQSTPAVSVNDSVLFVHPYFAVKPQAIWSFLSLSYLSGHEDRKQGRKDTIWQSCSEEQNNSHKVYVLKAMVPASLKIRV